MSLRVTRWIATSLFVAAAAMLAVLPAVAADRPGPLVEVDWLKRNLDRPDLVILDIRAAEGDRDPYAEGHIPGALHAPYPGGWRTTRDGVPGQLPPIQTLELHLGDFGITGAETVVIVPAAETADDFGGAARVYWTLKLVGVDDVTILNGGYRAWNGDAAARLSTEVPAPQPEFFTAELREDLLVSSDELRARIADGSTVLLDGRSPDEFSGKEKSPAARRYGRLPGAVNLEHSLFFDAATGRIVPRDEAMRLIPANAADPDIGIVSYCNSGHWAATNWFVLSQVLGYSNVALFDDSMIGWTEDPGNPVESERTRLDDLRDWWSQVLG